MLLEVSKAPIERLPVPPELGKIPRSLVSTAGLSGTKHLKYLANSHDDQFTTDKSIEKLSSTSGTSGNSSQGSLATREFIDRLKSAPPVVVTIDVDFSDVARAAT
jgi:hypothetical protein